MGDESNTNESNESVNESNTDETTPKARKPRGFAAISPERRKEISSAGGKAAHAQGTAHEFTSEEAKVAGIRGGRAAAARKRAAAARSA